MISGLELDLVSFSIRRTLFRTSINQKTHGPDEKFNHVAGALQYFCRRPGFIATFNYKQRRREPSTEMMYVYWGTANYSIPQTNPGTPRGHLTSLSLILFYFAQTVV